MDNIVQENKFEIKMNDSNFLLNIQKESFIEKDPPDIFIWLESTIILTVTTNTADPKQTLPDSHKSGFIPL